MTVQSLKEFLASYPDDAEFTIEVRETHTNRFVDSTACITVKDDRVPTLRIDIEAGKLP